MTSRSDLDLLKGIVKPIFVVVVGELSQLLSL